MSVETLFSIFTLTGAPKYQDVAKAIIVDHSFLHPDDAGWPGLKPKPQEKRVTPSSHKDVTDSLPNKPHVSSSPPRRFEPRAAPLLSQDDLFLKKLLSEEVTTIVPLNQTRRQTFGVFDEHRDRGTDNKRSKDDASRNDNRNRSQRPYEDFSYLGVKKPTSSANPSSACTHKAYLVGQRLVCQATEDAIAQARDEKKLKAYTELASMLSKTSSNGPTAVTPTLADILLRHAQGKQRIEDNNAAIAGVWNKVFDVLTSDISRTADSVLADAVKKITEAADLASKPILSEASNWEKQQSGQPSDASKRFVEDAVRDRFSKHEVAKESEMDLRRDPKRRRVSNISPTPDMYTPARSIVKDEQSMHEILSQMKSKIDEQALSLQKLMKENNEAIILDHCMNVMTSSSTPILLTTVSPSSPPASDTEDAYNTAEARIHFGLLKSPEKPIAAIVARRNSLQTAVHSPSLRRSPRLSTPLPQLPVREYDQEQLREEMTGMNVVEEDEEAVDEEISRTGTPDVERDWQNEPPSALAIKISRAYDNPSPPPSPSVDSGLAGLVSSSSSPHPSLPPLIASLHDATNGVSNLEDTTPSTPSHVGTGSSRTLSPIPPTIPSTSSKSTPPDLISFESFSSPAPVFRAMSPSISTPRPSHTSAIPEVDKQASGPFNFSSPPKAGETQVVSKPTPVYAFSHGEDEVGKVKDAESIAQDHQEQAVLHSVSPTEEETPVKSQMRSASHPDDSTQTLIRHSSRPSGNASRYQRFDQFVTRLSHPQRASAGNTQPQSIPHLLQQDERTIPEATNRGTEEDPVMNSPLKSTFFRELGSLSPTSNDLLSSLVTSSQHSSSFPLTFQPTKETSNLPQRIFLQSSPVPALPQTPRRSTGPIRLSSPSRSTTRDSNETQFQAISSDITFSTPARRISIEDAIAQGYISPLKGSQLLANTGRVALDGAHKPLLTIPPSDSPARRVPALPVVTTPVLPKKWEGMRFGSPTRSSSQEPYSSVQSVAAGSSKGKFRERSGSVPPSVGTSSSLLPTSASDPYSIRETSKPAKLPFPLVPPRKDIPPTIPEEDQIATDSTMASPTKISRATFSSPTKSSLKQTTSRIPTRTVKPYAKPRSDFKVGNPSRTDMQTMDTSRSEHVGPKIFYLSSDELIFWLFPLNFKNQVSSRTYRRDSKVKPTGTVDKPQASPISLKRKRTVVEMPPPVKSRPAVTLRQVPRVLVPNPTSNSGAKALPSITVPKKPQQLRRVIDKPPDVATHPSAHPVVQPVTSTSSSAPSTQTGALVPEVEIDGVKSDEIGTFVSEGPSGENILAPVELIDTVAPPEPVIPNGVRRTTRVRKVLNPSLISDALVPADVKPRRKPSSQTGDTTFYGMSATALRALTTSNTVRNQRYLAAKLETEIIRREGDRPESPAVKIKTVLQREQEEKKRRRKERAVRRGRSGETGGNFDDKDRHSDKDTENESDWDDQSASPSPKRHKRGPGDEEEYKTPVRKLGRLKLVDDDDKEESVENERRVKWDRGLFTTISLDQVKLGTRRPPMENIIIKGCLAPAAKTLPLDNLGNLPYADIPLKELVEENVVVKRFVYDNDVEAVEEVIVKNTRARNKKGKS
ncbi:hypothetical protein C0992_010872 [Termitomyces sp. T32_za158]|nr:hypothetical protein C0992_010872 [Termitomyces sp. T32_za158]